MYIYFYLEAYYVKKYDLLKRLEDFQPEAHLHGHTWSRQHLDTILRYIEECEVPRSGEDCFCSEYDIRLSRQCLSTLDTYGALKKLCAIQDEIGPEIKSKIVFERKNTDL